MFCFFNCCLIKKENKTTKQQISPSPPAKPHQRVLCDRLLSQLFNSLLFWMLQPLLHERTEWFQFHSSSLRYCYFLVYFKHLHQGSGCWSCKLVCSIWTDILYGNSRHRKYWCIGLGYFPSSLCLCLRMASIRCILCSENVAVVVHDAWD